MVKVLASNVIPLAVEESMISPSRAWKWPPRAGEPVINARRYEEGLREDGKVIKIFWDDEQVVVQYSGRKVVSVINSFIWNGRVTTSHHWVVDGIMHHSNIDRNLTHPGGDQEWFTFEEFQGTWESSEGGRGAWVV